jgi:hypothetical protein
MSSIGDGQNMPKRHGDGVAGGNHPVLLLQGLEGDRRIGGGATLARRRGGGFLRVTAVWGRGILARSGLVSSQWMDGSSDEERGKAWCKDEW